MKLEIDNVYKHYKDKKAVDGVSFELSSGVWGLLGDNGAGKTTLMRMIAGILAPTSGDIRYDGVSIHVLKEKYRDVFGYLPQEFGFYPEFTVQDYLEYMSALKGLPKDRAKSKIDDMLEKMTLTDVRKKRIVKLSGGMKRRVGIAQALLNDPEVLILDEPTSGLDPAERVRFRNLLSEYARDRIVLISTHIVSDIEYISTHNAIMKDGKIVEEGSTEDLLKLADGKVWTCRVSQSEVMKLQSRLKVANLRNEEDGSVELRYISDQLELPDSSPVVPHLEDVYLMLSSKKGGNAQ
ncbi:MAG: ABC transporter ATP-binding protein [Eubacteriales bacterium]|nr:ABC transporter ATP-binding protein [Eubacteriales bacterium]